MDHSSPAFAVLMEAMGLLPAQALALEEGLKERPDDPKAHVQLVGYYGVAAATSQEAADALNRHLLWLIRHAPTEPVLISPYGAVLVGEAEAEAQEAWMEQIVRHSTSAAVQAGAARFFASREPVLASGFLARAKSLDPSGDWEWRDGSKGGQVPSRAEAIDQLEAKLSAETDPLLRFYSLTSVLMTALHERDLERLRRYGRESLELAPRFPNDWNHGNGLHLGHSALGLVALDSGDVEAAVEHLLASARTPGSPQLGSFGPDLTLAQLLLERGQRDAVRRFLEQCQGFWTMGSARLHFWLEALRTGQSLELRKLA